MLQAFFFRSKHFDAVLESKMGTKHHLGDLRAAIEQINRDIATEQGSGVAQNGEVLVRLKKDRASLVTHCSSQLIDMALTKLLNDVCRRNAGSTQSEIFSSYSRIPERVTISRGVKKQTSKLTILEAKEWLGKHTNRDVVTIHDGMQKLIEDCIDLGYSEGETIEGILTRSKTGSPTMI